VVVVTYGLTARLVRPAIEQARRKGIKVGHLRLVTIWPFAEWVIRELSGKVGGFCVVEMNLGQLVFEVERCAAGKAKTVLCGHAGGGLFTIEEIRDKIFEAAGEKVAK
ncbi:MAG: 2-oxoacid:acceptor oxidoreductase subunit alpha, partial [Planctomycetota bacterium]|nr:2-oxoacid:acceptor oxidoreductase subunit alpha [Planctomycetota bacterium]